MICYKGTDKELKCVGHQFRVGEKAVHDGSLRMCNAGFHACKTPLDVLTYYPPINEARYFKCKASGEIIQANHDSKICAKEITLTKECGLVGLIAAQIEMYSDAATQGYRAHAATQGYCAHAATQGYCAHAATQGYCAHAEVHGMDSIAATFGADGKVLGELGDWLVCAEWELEANPAKLVGIVAARVDGEAIKPNTWYTAKGGRFVEAGVDDD